MIKQLKSILKSILFHLRIDLTRNQLYDRQTLRIMKNVLQPDSCCIDIGCHKGEMLDNILKYSHSGPHWAFEPIPSFYDLLIRKYKNLNIIILPFALAAEKKKVTFNYVTNDPAFSGIKKRKYNCSNPEITEIEVDAECLDHVITADHHIDFIKIDVEGGEFGVLQGATALLKRDKPLVIFEFGLGAADYYNTTPEMMYNLLHSCGLKISLMGDFLKNKGALSEAAFSEQFNTGRNYYFIAHP